VADDTTGIAPEEETSMARQSLRLSRAVALLGAAALIATGVPQGVLAQDASSKIGLMLPDQLTPRYEQFDKPMFEAAIAQSCPDCEVLYLNAQGDPAKQLSQAEQLITNGAAAIVLDPVDAAASAAIVELASSKGVPIIGYDRLPAGPVSYAVMNSLVAIGERQATALLDALAEAGTPLDSGVIVAINGDATTAGVDSIIAGRDGVLGDQVTIGKEYFTKTWDPAEAQKEMDQAINALGKDQIIGVYVMNDGMAGGVAASLDSAGVSPYPPITGLDGDLPALQRIVAGKQDSTLFRPYALFAGAAAEAALALASGKAPPAEDEIVQNTTGHDVPAVYPATPVIITRETLKQEMIDKGYITAAEVCTAELATACAEAGIQ
jgi:D-xylose transport system substrate-binding protein